MFSLEGLNALVIGGTGGIGPGINSALACAGANVIPTSRDRARMEEAVSAIQEMGGSSSCGLVLNMTKKSGRNPVVDLPSIRAAAAKLKRHLHGSALDILVMNAGGNVGKSVIGPGDSFFDTKPEDAAHMAAFNYLGPRECLRVFGGLMLASPAPVIVCTCSQAPLGLSRVGDYRAMKAGLQQLVQFLALDLGRKQTPRFRVNAVAPGFVRGQQNRFVMRDKRRLRAINNHIVLPHWGNPEDVGAAVVYLCSPAAKYVTGETLVVDGGFGVNKLGNNAI